MFVVNSKFRNNEKENLIAMNKKKRNAEIFLWIFVPLFRK
tara:strand:+ start:1157 stop:1276 length:120 start_codon:yes stop_codon:yes gene_type:complete